MKGTAGAILAFVIVSTSGGNAAADITGKKVDAKREFERHCASCHPDGGNTVNPAKTLNKKDMDANGIRTPADVVRVMRNPGPGMTAYDPGAIPDREAEEIARYIWKTFR